jgi:hypothetical protein
VAVTTPAPQLATQTLGTMVQGEAGLDGAGGRLMPS